MTRSLDPTRPRKPLDFGGGGITGSVDSVGRIIALNAYHPRHGYITLTSAAPFPETERYNPAAVRAYRRGLAALEGFGLTPAAPLTTTTAVLVNEVMPQIRVTAGSTTIETLTYAAPGGAVQRWNASGTVFWNGTFGLQRAAYTQLTEGGPIPAPPLTMRVKFASGVLTIENPALDAAVAVVGLQAANDWQQEHDGLFFVEFGPFTGSGVLAFAFGATADSAAAAARALYAREAHTAAPIELASPSFPSHLTDAARRGLTYGVMCAVPVSESVCILTDHMLLPLSWNRDAYYVARALLAWGEVDIVRRHLLWMFEAAERPDGFWGRCYLANGRIKDPAFQLDQQLFPLLELAEYVIETGDRSTLECLQPHIAPLLEKLMRRKAGAALLFPTDETPADDPIALPYHFSSHVLFWRVLMMLERAGVPGGWREMAETLHVDTQRHFTADHAGKRLYAYATDGGGHNHFYHDANDFPLALAPAWGFCPADDPIWRGTVDFAWSDANEGGFYNGRLGSVHTRAAWPLGDVQEMIIARVTNDSARLAKARRNLERAAQWDGALPEATEPGTGEVVSRTWFAWPNAALACFELGAFDL